MSYPCNNKALFPYLSLHIVYQAEWLKCGHEDIICKAAENYQLAQKEVQNHQELKLNQLKVIHPIYVFTYTYAGGTCVCKTYEEWQYILILSFSFMKLDINELRSRMDEIEEAHIADITSEQVASEGTLAKMRSIL